jgi:hypothetical protein
MAADQKLDRFAVGRIQVEPREAGLCKVEARKDMIV